MPHPHIFEFARIQVHEIVEKLHLRHEHVDGFQGLAKLKGERDAVPEIVIGVSVHVPDVELKFCSSPIMEGPIVERRMSAEDLLTGLTLQFFQLGANLLKLPDRML